MGSNCTYLLKLAVHSLYLESIPTQMSILKKLSFALAAIALLAIGFLVARGYYVKATDEHTDATATVLLEQVEKVFKLVTVEGNFSEIYDQTTTKAYTVYMPFPTYFSFPKSATVQVTGKVLVGFDMEGVTMTLDSSSRTVILKNIPKEAEILAIDHELSYKNLKDSYFNTFKPEDYTKLNANAKRFLEEKAKESRLLDDAREQGNQLVTMVQYLVESAGWNLAIEQDDKVMDADAWLD